MKTNYDYLIVHFFMEQYPDLSGNIYGHEQNLLKYKENRCIIVEDL